MRHAKGGQRIATRFSDHYELGRSQAELDFVDIPLDTDIRLFVDPYALSLDTAPWFVDCGNLVIDFFQLVLDGIRSGDPVASKRLLAHLHEPNETHLGYSSGRPAGRGIGAGQAGDLHERLSHSQAAATGVLQDLTDCELVIPGISSDKISDMTINIIKGKLIEYTEQQCSLFNMPTRRVSSGPFWDFRRRSWVNTYANLPVYAGRRIVLVPKAAVRYRLAVDHQEYYRDFVLEYLQAEHLEAGSSLVTLLKNGRRVVRKKDLKERYPCSKPYLLSFTADHPEVLDRYKRSLVGKSRPLYDESIEEVQPDPRAIRVRELAARLSNIRPGRQHAGEYHDLILGLLEALFAPNLRRPAKEERIHGGRKRIDITFENGDDHGFFFDLQARHQVKCPYILFECKNCTGDPASPELDQLTGRLSPERGMFGMLVCRRVVDRARMLEMCRHALRDKKGYILCLDDGDIKALVMY
jgi:hypothetical protein